MKHIILMTLIMAVLLLCPAARADEGPDFVGDKMETVLDRMKFARENLTKAHLRDGSNVPAETEEELKAPVIPVEDAKRVVNRGILTALAEHCGLDWNNQSYVSFMTRERAKKIWSDKQMAYIGMVHGATQGSILKLLSQKEPCGEDKKKKIQILLDRLDK